MSYSLLRIVSIAAGALVVGGITVAQSTTDYPQTNSSNNSSTATSNGSSNTDTSGRMNSTDANSGYGANTSNDTLAARADRN